MEAIENGWTSRIKELEAEVEQLRSERLAIQNDSRVVTCVFCGRAYPPGTPPSNHAALVAHVEECPKHPMRKYKLRAEAAEGYLAVCRDVLTLTGNSEEELSRMKELLVSCGQVEMVPVIDQELLYRKFRAEN
ncbi:MAG: hypothetical protein LLG97_19510 [Deltaproteobacteria bacterium]|nr:hypothetical protein [Deltaproteobacteria bacterium]